MSVPLSPTDPAYYHDTDPREARLRADFTRSRYLREIAPYGETPDQVVEFRSQANGLRTQWIRSEDPAERRLWSELDAATRQWTDDPEATLTQYFRLAEAVSAGHVAAEDPTWRNLHHTAVITGRIEPAVTGSIQDAARSRPHDETRAVAADPTSVLDRALGGRGPDIGSITEVEEIIAAADALLEAEEQVGDSGADQPLARSSALRLVQDSTAEHARTSERFAGITSHDLDLIERLDELLGQARDARAAAFDAGATSEQIHTAYLSGRDGTYSHDTATDGALARPESAVAVDAAVAAAIGPGPDSAVAEPPPLGPDLDAGPRPEIGVSL
ncbi:hypothetical protein [Nocardia takedensis]|uniref:hypothetical protein n=1 Tax=Nocardia takedensis TaxID=259390 RepID=UPI0002E6CB83|nr:hypothetical protein [Nocardia takedensis]